MKIIKTGKKITENNINEIEEKIDFQLPNDYKDFLLVYNGGRPIPSYFKVPNWKYKQSYIMEFKGVSTNHQGLDLLELLEIKKFDLPKYSIPIGSDPGGNLILLMLSEKNYGEIYFWDHENEPDQTDIPLNEYPNLYLLAGSFAGFINNLTTEEELNI